MGATRLPRSAARGSTGTRLFSVSGRVRRPGNYEIELHRTTFRDLIFDAELGGGVVGDRAITAFFPGASFPWLGPEHLDLRLDIDDVAAAGSSLASGLVVLDDTVCPIRVATRLVRFFAEESCGKCTPCREGTPWLEKIMSRIVHGYGRLEDIALLEDIGTRMGPGTTICALGPSAVAPISSTLMRFRDHYLAHIHGRLPVGDAGPRRVASEPWRAVLGAMSHEGRPLQEYRKKRDFANTPEPAPAPRDHAVPANPASSCRSTTRGVSTGISASSTTACSGRGRFPRASRC